MATPSPPQRPTIRAGGIRRSFTQPPRTLSFHERAGLDPSDSAADILYSHSRARIVSFTLPTDVVRSASNPSHADLDYPVDTIETLPWASSNEEVLASGSLIIEKIRGSTNFLKSGAKPLHALMRNSQCWCVDGEATLVMRIGTFKYCRIELPHKTEADKADVQRLKDILTKIIRFETTPCPFKRGFHVDLPESATTPRKKGRWKPRQGSSLSSPGSLSPLPLMLKKTRAQAASEQQETQSEAESTSADVEDVNGHGCDDNSSFSDRDEDQHKIAMECNDIDSSVDSDPRTGHHTPDLSSNSEWMDDRLRDRPPDADDGGKEERDIADDQSSSNPSEVENSSSQFPDGHAEELAKANQKDDQPCNGTDIGDSPVPGKTSLKDVDPECTGATGNVHDLEPEIALVPCSLADGLEFSSESVAQKEEPLSELEQSTIEGSADVVGSMQDRISDLQKQEISNDGVGAEAGKTEPDSVTQPTEPNEIEQRGQASAEYPMERASIDRALHGDSVDEVVQGLESPRTTSDSDPQLSDTVSVSSHADSFHSIASEPSIAEFTDPTPLAEEEDPLSHPHIHHSNHSRDTSEMTITVGNATTLETNLPVSPNRPSTATSENPSTPSLHCSSASDSSWPDVETPTTTNTESNLRRRVKKRRSFSPLPPSSNLLVPAPQSPRGNHLTGAILRKACNMALGKPIEVVFMFVHILARIARGATLDDVRNGELFRSPKDTNPTHRRNHSLPEHTDGNQGGISKNDDHAIPIRGRSRSAAPEVREDEDADSLFDVE